ncbi:Protein of unknown function (AIG1 domain) [endosymbiont DhMRE of Dentiscutata heterogama]|uniref:GTPase n=1 Tax=endosymbiont DhMRE of Dentiscutata heterogama TaxID=1609546 RepID=UPI000629D70D|nr:GTPase [endosymbiont DhMRE of Dentiscutata heterogama]CFW92771.1 Protein of unknown function (AIG1 domain) [endosymbiont DhMRE of Dentiscutata heterogama]
MVRNILIVGITGSGKSALANVLTGTNDFKEKESGVSVTREFQKSSNPFQNPFQLEEGANYYVIDNVGFGDNRSELSKEVILYEVAKAIYFIREELKQGINQVFFVFSEKFSKADVGNFNLFKGLILESGITKFTTLVRTNFKKFEDSQKCKEDQQALLETNKEIEEIIESCNDILLADNLTLKILHVDNPTLDIAPADDEDDEDKIERENKINENGSKRGASREKLLKHLGDEHCSGTYNLREQSKVCKIYDIIANHTEEKEIIEEISAFIEQNTQKQN